MHMQTGQESYAGIILTKCYLVKQAASSSLAIVAHQGGGVWLTIINFIPIDKPLLKFSLVQEVE